MLSNNWHADVYRFARRVGDAHRGQGLKAAAAGVSRGPAEDRGSRRRHGRCWRSAGDPDVLGAHLTGMKAYMLQPLVEQDLPHTLLLRNVERAILGDRKPEPAINIAECEASRSAARRGQGSAPRRFGRARSAGSKGPRAKREGNRCEREAVCAGAPGEPFEIAGHVQRRLREGGAAPGITVSWMCRRAPETEGVPCGSRLPFHQHHHAL